MSDTLSGRPGSTPDRFTAVAVIEISLGEKKFVSAVCCDMVVPLVCGLLSIRSLGVIGGKLRA
jgi:hypothetical protein